MADEWHVKWLKEGVKKWNKRRKKVQFRPKLSGVNFFDLLPPDFRDAPKTSRYFEGIDLSGADLDGADLSGLNFRRAKFARARMLDANLSRSNFEMADFDGADLAQADLSRALFKGALFRQAELRDVNVGDADITSAIFVDCSLDFAQRVSVVAQNAKIYSTVEAYERSLPIASAGPALKSKSSKTAEATQKITKFDVFFGTNRKSIVEKRGGRRL